MYYLWNPGENYMFYLKLFTKNFIYAIFLPWVHCLMKTPQGKG